MMEFLMIPAHEEPNANGHIYPREELEKINDQIQVMVNEDMPRW